MRDLDRPLADGHQAGGHQVPEHALRYFCVHGDGRDLVPARAASRVLLPLVDGGEPEEHPACDVLIVFRQLAVHPVGCLRDRLLDTACVVVRLERERVVFTPAPRLEQRVREEGEGAGLVTEVGQDLLHQAGLECQARPGCRSLDRSPQLVLRHTADERLAALDRSGERGKGGTVTVEVGSHGKHHYDWRVPCRGVEQRVHECTAFGVVGTQGERLLELVDQKQQACVRRRLEQRLPKRQDDMRRVAAEVVCERSRWDVRKGGEPHRELREWRRTRRQVDDPRGGRFRRSLKGGHYSGVEDGRLAAA